MNDPAPRTYSLATAAAAIRARTLPILLAGALLAAAALAFTLSTETRYQTKAYILARDPGFADQAFDPQVTVNAAAVNNLAETDLAGLFQVAELTAQKLGGGISPNLIETKVDVKDTGTGLISIEGDAPTADGASELANAYAEAAIESRRDAQVAVIDQAIRASQQELADLPAASAERRSLERKLAQLRDYRAFQTGNLEQVQRAVTPGDAEVRPIISSMIGGGIAGILLAIAATLLVDRIRPRIMDRRSAEEVFGAPVIAIVERGSDATRSGPDSIESARGRILHRGGAAASPPRVLLVLPVGDEPALEVAQRLAAAIAESGRRCVLVDAGLGDPDPGGANFADAIEGSAKLSDAIASGPGGAEVIALGRSRPDAAALLERQKTAELLDGLAHDYQQTVICAPSPLERPDALPLISRADAILVVVGTRTPEERCLKFRREITQLGGALSGAVFVAG